MTKSDGKDKTTSSLSLSEYIVNGKKCSELLQGVIDYDGASIYPSSKMGVSSDPMVRQYINNLKSKNERLKDDE